MFQNLWNKVILLHTNHAFEVNNKNCKLNSPWNEKKESSFDTKMVGAFTWTSYRRRIIS